jgi:hypothetical protein
MRKLRAKAHGEEILNMLEDCIAHLHPAYPLFSNNKNWTARQAVAGAMLSIVPASFQQQRHARARVGNGAHDAPTGDVFAGLQPHDNDDEAEPRHIVVQPLQLSDSSRSELQRISILNRVADPLCYPLFHLGDPAHAHGWDWRLKISLMEYYR